MISSFWQDLRYAVRLLVQSPGYACVAVAVLALGIGANTAIFSVIDAVFLRPPPYADPGRLMVLWTKFSDGSSQELSNFPNYLDWRAAQRSFTDLALISPDHFNLSFPGEAPERLDGLKFTANYLAVLGVHPVLGRNCTPQEDTPGGPKVLLLGESLWRNRFGADPSVLGKRLEVDGMSREVVGILPATADFAAQADVFVPWGDERMAPENVRRDWAWTYRVVGRLKPGVTPQRANQDLNNIAHELERRYPASNTGIGIDVHSLLEATVGDYRDKLFLLLGAVGCVLFIACANVANLQLARATARQRELAIRAALGAGRGRLMRQMLTESALLGLLGGVAGCLLALWALDGILALSPANVPRVGEARIDLAALGFAFTVAFLGGLIVGVSPAVQLTGHAALAAALHEGSARGSSGGASQRRLAASLVVVQVALSVVLLAGAGLLLRSFWRARNEPVGFRRDGLLLVTLQPDKARYDTKEKRDLFAAQLLDRVQTLPGVAGAALSNSAPYSDSYRAALFHLTGTPADPPGREQVVLYNVVSPGYFKAMGIPFLRGRDFTAADVANRTGAVIIDAYCAQHFFAGKDPIGQYLDGEKNEAPRPIIGVVGRVRDHAPDTRLDAAEGSYIYFCKAQDPLFTVTLLLRVASGDPQALAEPVRRAIKVLDPNLPLSKVLTMDQLIDTRFQSRRLLVVLLATFAGVALLLASIGLYGVMALGVTQRTRELGIRMALGAQRASVLGLVMRQGTALVGLGLLIGLGGALASGRLLTSLVYGVAVNDPMTLALVAGLLGAVAMLATYLPARRATSIDPLKALREE